MTATTLPAPSRAVRLARRTPTFSRETSARAIIATRSWLAELSLAQQRPGLALFLADGAIEEQHRCLRVTPSDPDCIGFMVRHHCVRAPIEN